MECNGIEERACVERRWRQRRQVKLFLKGERRLFFCGRWALCAHNPLQANSMRRKQSSPLNCLLWLLARALGFIPLFFFSFFLCLLLCAEHWPLCRPIIHPKEEEKKKIKQTHSAPQPTPSINLHALVDWLDCWFVVWLACPPRFMLRFRKSSRIFNSFHFSSALHTLGRPPRKQFTNSISLPILKEQWKWICELIAGRVIIAVINQLSFIIQNKVFHYCRQQVYSCSNNCTVIIHFYSIPIQFSELSLNGIK